MALAGSMQLSRELGIQNRHGYSNQPKIMMAKDRLHLLSITLSSHASRQDALSLHLLNSMRGSITPVSSRCEFFLCRSFLAPGGGNEISVLKSAALVLTRSCNALRGRPLVLQLVPAVSIVAFAAWGLGPLMRLSRNLFLNKTDSSWKKSSTYYVLTYYLQPLLLWIGAMLICRALDPIILPSKESQAVKQRLLIFIRSLSTVLASAYCLSSLIQQVQNFFMENNDSSDARTVCFCYF